MKAAWLLLGLAAAGCSSGEGRNAPSRAYITSLRCQGLVRTLGKQIEDSEKDQRTGKYPADPKKFQFPPSLRCPLARAETLTYQVSPDGTSFQFYCKGDHHVPHGFAPDYPRYSSGKGVEARPGLPLEIPRGFPLNIPFKSILLADAEPDESVDVVLEYEQEGPVLEKLGKSPLSQPVMRGADYNWIKQDIPGADQLSVVLQVKERRAKIHYFPSHLIDGP